MRVNVTMSSIPEVTYQGAVASAITPIQALRRTMATCMMWEDNFYESGQTVATRMMTLVPQCLPSDVAELAIELRDKQKLRHAPLALVREMVRHQGHKALVASTLEHVIQRADELSEFLAIYWKDGKTPIAHCVQRGLRAAFNKFSAYDIAKWDKNNATIALRDVAFLVHAKPSDMSKGKLLAQLCNKDHYPTATKASKYPVKEAYGLGDYERLPIPDTWETVFSAIGQNPELTDEQKVALKRQEWLRLMHDHKLGGLAFLRNLRNMAQVGVPKDDIALYGTVVDLSRVLPYRFIAAANVVPAFEDMLEPMMLSACEKLPKIGGKTKLLVDVSGSMDDRLSDKSDLKRVDAACALAILLREQCEDVTIATFSNELVNVAPRKGFALRDAILKSQEHIGTNLRQAVDAVNAAGGFDRLIVITDEQTASKPADPKCDKAYMINVANAKNGVGYGVWLHIDGWSEAVIDYITKYEAEFA